MSRKGEKVPGHGTAAGKHAGEQRPLTSVSTRRQRVAAIAKKYPDSPISTLSHHMDLLWMREAYGQLNRRSAVGVDGESVAAFGERLDERLSELLEQAKSGSYRAPPVLRKQIPKNEKETRPIGIPTTANKVLERAVTMLLEPIYEQDFIDGSYGFRLNRNTHDALEVIRQSLMQMGGGWVLDVDVQKYFDTIQHSHLRDTVCKRVKDGVILFEHKADAEQVKDLLPERFGKYGLTIHPEKTQLVDFRRPDRAGQIQPQTFDFLGFTHYWGKTLKKGLAVKKKTASKKFKRPYALPPPRILRWADPQTHFVL